MMADVDGRGPAAQVLKLEIHEGGPGIRLRGVGPAGQVLLPYDLKAAPFTGRKDELATIEEAFADRDCGKVFILFGKPGVGKSRLAIEYATRHQALYPGGVFNIPWDGAPPSKLAMLGRMLGVPSYPDLCFEEQCAGVLAHLGREPTLLIYDNVPDQDALASWLPSVGAKCHVLVTSTYGYWSAPLGILEVGLLPNEDGRLLVSRLVRDARAAARYAEQIVARARGITMELCAVARSVDDAIQHRREASLRSALAPDTASSFTAAWNLLTDDARLLLRAACLFAIGRIPPDALRALLAGEDWDDARIDTSLDGVRDRGLLTEAAEVYDVHQLVAHFVREQQTPEIPEGLLLRHFEAFTEAAGEFDEHPGDAQQRRRFLAYPAEFAFWSAFPSLAEGRARRACRIGDALFEAGRFDDALLWYQRAVLAHQKGDIRDHIDHESLGASLHQVGICHWSLGRFEQALPWFQQAVDAARKGDLHGRIDHQSLGASLHEVGICHWSLGRFEQALPWFQQAVDAKQKGDLHDRVDHQSLGRSLHQVGFCHSNLGHFDQALSWFQKAVDAKQKGNLHDRVDHESLGASLYQVGFCHWSLGHFDQALSWFQQAVDAAQKGDIHGRIDHESVGRSLHQVGSCHASLDRFNEALPWFQQAVDAKQKGELHGRIDHESVGRSLHQMGSCHSSIGHFDQALSWFQQAVDAKQKGNLHDRVDHESLGASLYQVGFCHWSLSRFEQALSCFQQAVGAVQKGDIHGHVDNESVGRSLHQVGLCHASLGRFNEALPWFQQAVDAMQKGDFDGRIDHESVGRSLHQVGLCHASLGRFNEALPWFQQAVDAMQNGNLHRRIDHDGMNLSLNALRDCRTKLGLPP